MICDDVRRSGDEKAFKPGDWIEKENVGRELTFDEITKNIGNLIVLDKSTESHEWFQVVLVEEIVTCGNSRRFVFFDGKKQRGYVNEIFFKKSLPYPRRAYELNKNGTNNY